MKQHDAKRCLIAVSTLALLFVSVVAFGTYLPCTPTTNNTRNYVFSGAGCNPAGTAQCSCSSLATITFLSPYTGNPQPGGILSIWQNGKASGLLYCVGNGQRGQWAPRGKGIWTCITAAQATAQAAQAAQMLKAQTDRQTEITDAQKVAMIRAASASITPACNADFKYCFSKWSDLGNSTMCQGTASLPLPSADVSISSVSTQNDFCAIAIQSGNQTLFAAWLQGNAAPSMGYGSSLAQAESSAKTRVQWRIIQGSCSPLLDNYIMPYRTCSKGTVVHVYSSDAGLEPGNQFLTVVAGYSLYCDDGSGDLTWKSGSTSGSYVCSGGD